MAERETGEVQDLTKEFAMRKVVAVEFVSVDGVMGAPEEWAFSYTNDEMEEANASGMAALRRAPGWPTSPRWRRSSRPTKQRA
jgi:hypothetical protein